MDQVEIISTDGKPIRPPRQWYRVWHACVALVCCSAVGALAQEMQVSDRIPVADGHMVVCWKQGGTQSRHLLLHFHGAPDAVKAPFLRSRLDAVLAVVNLPGLSSTYSKPFERDERLFAQIVVLAAETALGETFHSEETPWQKVAVSSFSAGYGAVREILKNPSYFAQIDSLVAADSIYAGIQESSTHRTVNQQHMRDFLSFANQACDGRKTFVLSHSSQSTRYASTTETADYLLHALQVDRMPDTSIQSSTLRQTSRASKGQFTVLGFAGKTGADHMLHLRHIDLLWDRIASH